MKIEHMAFDVADPAATAAWYVENLGFALVRRRGAPNHAHFLADSTGQVLIEIYNNPAVQVPDYPAMDPLILHLAFTVDDVKGVRGRLLAAGATAAGEVACTPDGDELAMLRDPWGFPVQLVKRAAPMA